METDSNSKGGVNDETLASETYARILPELEKLSLDELVAINLDIPSVVATTLGALPEIRALRPAIVEQVPRFDLASFDKLEDYAFTLHYAHAQYLTATQPADDLDALAEEATALRETLLVDATALTHRGVIDGNKLKELQGSHGFKNLATDLGALSSVLRESWTLIQGRTSVQAEELDHAVKLGQRMMRLVGLREQGPATEAAATDLRVRAFTLLSRTYDDARRAVSFLRWNTGDVDRIAPSLYAGRSNGRRKAPEAPAAVAPSPPAASPAPPVSPAAPAQPAPHAAANGANTDPFLS